MLLTWETITGHIQCKFVIKIARRDLHYYMKKRERQFSILRVFGTNYKHYCKVNHELRVIRKKNGIIGIRNNELKQKSLFNDSVNRVCVGTWEIYTFCCIILIIFYLKAVAYFSVHDFVIFHVSLLLFFLFSDVKCEWGK